MVVRRHHVDGVVHRDSLAVDHVRDVPGLAADTVDLGEQGGGLRGTGPVVADGLVERGAGAEVAGDGDGGLDHGCPSKSGGLSR
jgi:hypothetical protein